MCNVVDINKYKQKEMKKMYQDTVNEIIKNRKEYQKIYKTSDMEKIALCILKDTGNDSVIVVPVVSIAKQIGFDTFQKRLSPHLSGYIGINKKYKNEFNTDKVICTNLRVNQFQQRFVIAHELAHFLFDYDHNARTYYNTYKKNDHEREAERRANTFAANLLMPKNIFINEYLKAIKIDPDPIFVMVYLSDTFKTPRKSILKRISEVGYGLAGRK